ncbi:S9 family peptidase [Caenimonas aquaedulcis]|uniref:S9 family peptidase n=1 Tax=Caenimonas aquaedulcis TaxID=2793270 RepID=A0A931MGT9_9BURK|nr:prolyl oligopeptidase family serine peptidase [Caenimonas aquaedulcis]MBG9387605.1 S9 family peptidase [Caenimonas aquaedulcis]
MKKFSPDDLFLHRKVMALDAAHGRGALAAVRSVDRAGNAYTSRIWRLDIEGGSPRQLTFGPGKDTSPRWSPDGKRWAFMADRGGSAQLYLMGDGGEARQLGQFELGVSDFGWSADGSALLVIAARRVDPDLRGKRGKAPEARAEEAAEVAWRLPYKTDGVGYLLAREMHLYRVPLDGSPQVQLTDGPFDVHGFDASPGGTIAYSRSREGRFAHRTDLWMCDADGGNARQLTRDFATVLQPHVSPDGRWIAFGGAIKEGDGETRLWLLEPATGRTQAFGPKEMELAHPDALRWSADSRSVIAARAHRGRHEAVRIRIDDEEAHVIAGGDRQFGAFAVDGERVFFSIDTPVSGSEVVAVDASSGQETAVSDFNPWFRERTPLELHSKSFRVPDGKGGTESIQGWLLHAQGAKGPMPLLDDAHGGPAAYALLDYDTNIFWQVLCSNGWAVLLLNTVGSSSFGSEFCSRLSGHWGEMDLPQHLAALRQLRAEGICDERIALSGKSYGGYFAAWAIGHCEEFDSAVVMAPVGNIETHYGTSDGGYYADPLYIGTAPQFDRKKARALSPLQSIEAARTPTLFMQGKEDERCPKCQSEELFVSFMRASDTQAELVLYPGEDHHFLGEGRPNCRADAARRIVEWVTGHEPARGPRIGKD